MSKQIILYGGLLVVSLVASYMTWTDDSEPLEKDAVVMFEAGEGDVTEILWDSEKLDLDINVRKDEAGTWLLVRSTESKKRLKPHEADPVETSQEPGTEPAGEANPDQATPPEAPPEIPAEDRFETYEQSEEFKAGTAGDDLLKALTPLTAKRMLGEVAPEKLEALGLAEPEATLTVRRQGKPDKVYEVGGEAYGTRDRYLRDKETGNIYLVKEDTLRALKFGNSRLPDRELVGLKLEQVDKVKIEAAVGSASFEQRNRADKEKAFWARPGATEASDPAKTWLDKLFKMKSADFVQDDEVPTSTEVMATVVFTDPQGKSISLQILKGLNPDGKESWYAKSDHTRMLVKLHSSQAKDLVEDLSAVVQ